MAEPFSPSFNSPAEKFAGEKATVGLPWRLLIFSIFIFVLALIVYFGLSLGYQSYLNSQSADLDQEINQLGSEVSQSDQQRFIQFYSQLVNLKEVLDAHPFAANIFTFLERNTHTAVYYYNAEAFVKDRVLKLKGRGSSVQSVIEQLSVFDKSPEVAKAILTELNTQKGAPEFSLTLYFSDSFFAKPTL